MKRVLLLLTIYLACNATVPAGLWWSSEKPKAKEVASVEQMGSIANRLRADPEPPPAPPQPDPLPAPTLPSLTLPDKVEGDVGTFIKITAQTNGSHVRWVAIDKGLAVFPAEMLKDSLSTVVMSSAPGEYRMLGYTAVGDIPSDPVTTMVVVHGAQPPPAPAPAPAPAPQPSNLTAQKVLVYVITDASKPVDPKWNAIAGNAWWQQMKAYGHDYRFILSTDPIAGNFAKMVGLNGGLPTVVIMNAVADASGKNKWLNQESGSLRVPDNITEMAQLVNRYIAKP